MSVKHHLSKEQLFEILEHVYNEVYVLDRNMNIIYVNQACYRNYGLTPEEMIGKNHNEFTGNIWFPSIVPKVYEEKRRMCLEQIVYTGKRVISTANPVINKQNEIEMVVCVTEETFEHVDIQYNPDETAACEAQVKPSEIDDFGEIIAVSDSMKSLYKAALRLAQQDLPVLLQGESGTGKSMLAKCIHDSGVRRKHPFIAVNCATIPATLMESELFGHKPHAFTGADPKGKIGLIRLADKGTLFLDEIAELILPLQAKLLDVLEKKTFTPVGGSEVERADVRIISATNKDLQDMVKVHQFREDLYWRINVVGIKIPALRQRKEDIDRLALGFLHTFNVKHTSQKHFSPEVLDIFFRCRWPGNIRQLRNTIERAVVIAPDDLITVNDLPQSLLRELGDGHDTECSLDAYKDRCLRKIIQDTYEKYRSSRKMAEALNISHTTANRLMKKYVRG